MGSESMRRMLRPLVERIKLVAARGIVRLVDDGARLQEIQVERLRGELTSGVENFQQFGLASHPEPGAEAIVLSLNGDRSHAVIIATEDRRYRLKVNPGGVALYDSSGSFLRFNADGSASMDCAGQVSLVAGGGVDIQGDVSIEGSVAISGPVNIQGEVLVTGNLTMIGNLQALGNIADFTGPMAAMRAIYNSHVHPTPAGTSGTTPSQQ